MAEEESPSTEAPAIKKHWKSAALKTKSLKDPWADLGFEQLPTTKAIRYRYNAKTKTWLEDDIVVKIQDKVCITPSFCVLYPKTVSDSVFIVL